MDNKWRLIMRRGMSDMSDMEKYDWFRNTPCLYIKCTEWGLFCVKIKEKLVYLKYFSFFCFVKCK